VVRKDDIRQRALGELRRYEVLMLDGHFDYGNGYHGPAYLNPHQLLRYPSTIWRLSQDLLDLVPDDVTAAADVVAGPPTGGALLAHTIAGLLDSRRSLTHPPCSFAPFEKKSKAPSLRPFYQHLVKGRRVLLADDVRPVRRPDPGSRRHGARRGVHLRPARVNRRSGCAGVSTGRIPRATELRRRRLPPVQSWGGGY
jgi:hypothetical protein